MLLALTMGFTACEDDNDDNPVLAKATTFKLNTPIFANQQVDLESAQNLVFTCSQPDYGFPMQIKYSLQYSLNDDFSVSVDEADADETKTATYQSGEESSSAVITLPAADLAKGLEQIAKWNEGLVPASQEVYVRVKAEPKAETAANVADYIIYSNSVKFVVTPYYVELSDAPVVMWYLVGNMFGGLWGSVPGETALPMFIIPDYTYDKKDGTGNLEYVNYFVTGEYSGNESGDAGFKIQPDDFNWDKGMTGDNGKKGVIKYRNKGEDGGHIVVEEDGYYRLVMDTKKLEGKFEKLDITPANYGANGPICLSGSFNDWSDTEMLPYNKEGVENHAWYIVVNFDSDKEVKFKLNGSWDSNWGSKAFPVGIGVNNGDNIPVPAGQWIISFCDITGQYSIIAK